MTSSIALPTSVGVPDREGYAAEFRQNKRRFQPEVGHGRQRKTVTEIGQLFTVRWTVSQATLQTFDDWWQNVINCGEKFFDLQLLDDDATLVWYTAQFVGGAFSAECLDQNPDTWQITARIHVEDDYFLDRPSGTDQLHGTARIETFGTMQLLISVTMRGLAQIEMVGTCRLVVGSIRGTGQIDTFGRGRVLQGALHAQSETELIANWVVEATDPMLRESGGGDRILREDGTTFLREV